MCARWRPKAAPTAYPGRCCTVGAAALDGPQKKPPSDEGGGICEANDGGRDRAATRGRPFVVASSISFASAYGESSFIPLLLLSPPNPRLSPLGFGGGPK